MQKLIKTENSAIGVAGVATIVVVSDYHEAFSGNSNSMKAFIVLPYLNRSSSMKSDMCTGFWQLGSPEMWSGS